MNEFSLGYRMHIDFILLFLIFILCSCGLVILYSASGQNIELVYSQIIKLLIALLCMIIVAQVPPANLNRLSLFLYIFGIILLLFVIIFGDIGKGAQRWLDLKIFRFQPSELMKIAVPVVISSYLSGRFLPPKFFRIVFSCIFIVIPVFLIAQQPDLGTALLVAIAGFSVIFIAGLFNDAVIGFPIGISSLTYLLICGFAAYLRNITLRPNLVNDWFFFLFTILVISAVNYFLLVLFFKIESNYYDLLGNIFFTFILYYIFAYIFDIYRRLVFLGKTND